MARAAEQAMRVWTNNVPGLTGEGNPLRNGSFLQPPKRSPASGAWALVSRAAGGTSNLVAEDGSVTTARIQWDVYSGDEQHAEKAAAGIASAVETLTGCPQVAGGMLALIHDNLSGPVYVPQSPAGGEPYCFQVQADIVLCDQ